MMGIGQHKLGLATEFYTEVFIDWIDVENKVLAIIFAITVLGLLPSMLVFIGY